MVTEGDLALIAARFGAALRGAGVPADPARCARFAAAVTVARPASRYQLYLCALATLVTGQAQVEPLGQVFTEFFGGTGAERSRRRAGRTCRCLPAAAPDDLLAEAARAAQQHGLPDRAAGGRRGGAGRAGRGGPGRHRAGRGGRRRGGRRTRTGPVTRRWPAGRNGWPAPTSPS